MSKALFITNTDLKRYSVLDGSLDPDKFLQYIEVAQDIHLQRYMGTDLYNKISADIVADTLTGDYLSLVNTYIKPMTIFWALVEYLPFAAYQVANKGVFKHTSENSTSVDKDEIDIIPFFKELCNEIYTCNGELDPKELSEDGVSIEFY